MDLDWLDDFLALVRCGSFSQAADQRHVTQPAFGRRIRALEQWVGVPLFTRSSRHVETSAAGLAFRPAAEEIVRQLAYGRDAAQDAERRTSGTIRLASTHALSSTFFPSWLSGVEIGAQADIHFHAIVDNMLACEHMMRQGHVQVLLCHHHDCAPAELDPQGFRRFTLAHDRLVPVCAPNADRQPRFPLSDDGKRKIPYLQYRSESGLGRILQRSGLLSRIEDRLAPAFHSHAALTLANVARTSGGVAWVPLSVVSPALASGDLVHAGGEAWEIEVEICLIRAAARQTAIVESLWALVRNPSQEARP